jgi:hypothetical protein
MSLEELKNEIPSKKANFWFIQQWRKGFEKSHWKETNKYEIKIIPVLISCWIIYSNSNFQGFLLFGFFGGIFDGNIDQF